jgi:hypothetical protein
VSTADDSTRVPAADVARFRRDGFVVLRDAFDPAPLVREVAAAFADGFAGTGHGNLSAEAAITFRYLPMMSERTPTSLGLLHRFLGYAEQFVGGDVVPVRAKAIEYHGGSSWHRDSELAIASLGFACYLDPLTGATGALRVVPGSHRTRGAAADGNTDGAVAVETAPGDVIVFDEHLMHASQGGDVRYQWRVDYLARPAGGDEQAVARDYFAGMYSPGWDGGYDVDAFPTYGTHWRRVCRPADGQVLADAGAYAAAEAEESAARRRQAAITRRE